MLRPIARTLSACKCPSCFVDDWHGGFALLIHGAANVTEVGLLAVRLLVPPAVAVPAKLPAVVGACAKGLEQRGLPATRHTANIVVRSVVVAVNSSPWPLTSNDNRSVQGT